MMFRKIFTFSSVEISVDGFALLSHIPKPSSRCFKSTLSWPVASKKIGTMGLLSQLSIRSQISDDGIIKQYSTITNTKTINNNTKTSTGLQEEVKRSKVYTVDSERTLDRLYERYPELQDYDRQTIVQYLEVMTEHAMNIDQAIEMVLMYPPLLKIYNVKAPYILAALRSEGFTEKQRRALLYKNPRLFELPRSHISQRMAFLKSYFTNSAEVRDLVLQSVESLIDNENILQRKLEYLIKSMSHDTKLIRNSKVLSYSLQYIKSRHEFLSRAGLYKSIPYYKLIKVVEKEKGSKTPRQKYFNPHEIVCTSDIDFLKICSKGALTVNELAAFEEIYSKELEQESDDEIFSDDEDNLDTADVVVVNSGGFSNAAEGDNFYF